MSDHLATESTRAPEPTIDDILAGVEPMSDLRRFVIDDLTADEEDEFYSILDNA